MKVHILVLLAFVGPPPEGMECRHFPDRDPTNNRLENLQWGTRQQNVDDQIPQGTRRTSANTPGVILTEAAVREIKHDAKLQSVVTPEWIKSRAKKHGVSYSTIRDIIIGRRWKNTE